MDPPSLDNPFAKLRRARDHLNALHEAAKAFAQSDPYGFTIKPDSESGWDVVYVQVRREPPIELGVVLGDFLHNLRSALDNLAWQLVLLNGGNPTGRTAFPIFTSPDDFEARGRPRLKGMSAAHLQVIEDLQPYPGRNGPRILALEVVNALANIDRHRIVNPSLAGIAQRDVPFVFRREPTSTDVVIEGQVTAAGKRLEDGAELARFRVRTVPEQPEVEVKANLLVEIAFGERGLRLYALPTIGIEVGEVVKSFEADFPA